MARLQDVPQDRHGFRVANGGQGGHGLVEQVRLRQVLDRIRVAVTDALRAEELRDL